MPTVKVFDEKEAEKQLKDCPPIVQEYVKLLKKSADNWKDIANQAIKKLRTTNHQQ